MIGQIRQIASIGRHGRTARLAWLVAGASALVAAGCEPAQTTRSFAPQTSRIALSEDGKTLFVALADHDQVRAVDADSGDVKGSVDVPGYPHRLTALADGRIAVTARYAGTVSIVDVLHERVDATVEVGADPFGVVEANDSLWVALGGENQLARVSLDDPTRVAQRIDLGYDDPRGVAVTKSGKIVVSHFTGRHLSVVEASDGTVASEIGMKLPSRAFFFPNQMDTLTVTDDGQTIVPHVECNNDPAQFSSGGGGGFVDAPIVPYYYQGPTGFPAVVPAVSIASADDGTLVSDDESPPPTLNADGSFTPVERAGTAPPIMNPLDRALLQDINVNAPVAVALVADGDLQLIVNQSSGNVVVRRTQLAAGQLSIIGVLKVGVGAEAIAVSPDGATAYVYNSFDDSVTSFAVPGARARQSHLDDGAANVGATGEITELSASTHYQVAGAVLPKAVRDGRRMFHSVDPSMTRFGAIACSSCHPGGADDSTTWSFAEGPRQSPALWGGILGTEPFHWDQRVADMADISRVTIQGRMGGSGRDRRDMDDIGAYLDQIPAPARSVRIDDDAAARGRVIFASAETQCLTCHDGDRGTDNLSHDVGTGVGHAARETASSFATPALHGLLYSGPYLHDGSAATLEQLVDDVIATDRMGKGSHLSKRDKADLVEYLKSL